MDIGKKVSLKDHSTMRLGGLAAYFVEVGSRNEAQEAVNWALDNKVPAIMIGQGSNIVWTDSGYPGLVIVNKIMGFEKFDEDTENTYLTVGSGENWDSVVARSVEAGLTGIEALSLVPGTVGATPVQNVGAYGQQISDVLVSVEAYDSQTRKFITIPNSDCAFSYRDSRFKSKDKGRFFITGLTLHLQKGNPRPPFYPSVQEYFAKNKVSAVTPAVLRQAVIAIRQAKLPDPAQVANNGSFFTNPIIDEDQLNDLLAHYPGTHYWRLGNGKVKISAAWLIEQAGFKGVHDEETGMGTWPNQALVLVNEKANSTADLIKFRQKILDKVQSMFGVTLVQEPELIGTQTATNKA